MFAYTSVYFDFPPVKSRAIDLWIPKDKPLRPFTLFFVHGGGWQSGHREQMHAIMAPFYELGYTCVSVDYRLGGATIADQLGDVREGMSLALQQLHELGIDQPFVLYGSSAGAHLALLAGLAPAGACGEVKPSQSPSISGIIASCAPVTFEPWEDIFPSIWDAMQRAAGRPYADDPDLYRRLSPERYASAASAPLFFLQAQCEHMFPNEQTTALVQRLNKEGGNASSQTYRLAEHGFFHSLDRRTQRLAFNDIQQFISTLEVPTCA